MIKITVIKTPLGEMMAAATRESICFLAFFEKDMYKNLLPRLEMTFNTTVKKGQNRLLRVLKKQLREYFKGTRREFSVPITTPGTGFQKAAWEVLRGIPYGKTISYLEQAKMLDNEGAVRAVANANAANRIAIIIPCHRVIGSDGSLTGYGGGLEKKQWLIEHEKKYSGKPVEGKLF